MIRTPAPRVLDELRALLRLAGPLAAAHAGQQLLSVVDTAIVGRVGAVELGAVGIGNAIFGSLMVVGIGLMLGLDPLTSQALGAGEHVRARRLMWQGVWLSLVVGVVLAVPVLLAPWMLPLFDIPPDVVVKARDYLWLRAPGLIPAFTFAALRSYLQARGITWPIIVSMVAANFINAVLTMLLVFGGAELPQWLAFLHWIPAWGVAGAAVASTACVVLQLIILAWAVGKSPVAGVSTEIRRAQRGEMLHAVRVGGPLALQMGAEVGVFALVGLLAGKLGERELAGHQVALTIASFSFMVSLGVGTAGSVRVGRAVGARDRAGVRLSGLCSFAFGGGFMLFSAVMLWAFPRFFTEIMTDQPEVISMSVQLLAVAAVFQFSDGIQAVGAGVLRGMGDTRFLSRANVVGHYLFGLPVAAGLAFGADMGIMGLWWGLCIGLSVVAVALFIRFWGLSRGEIVPLSERAG